MIAIISSTIYPPPPTNNTLYRGSVNTDDRLLQTVETVKSLLNHNFTKILIFDNSGLYWKEEAQEALSPAEVHRFNSYQYINKGLSELFLLLNALPLVPDNCQIFKISGRYKLSQRLDEQHFDNYDIAAKVCDKTKTMITRAYYVKDKQQFETTLHSALNYIYAYPQKIVGPGSLKRVLRNAFSQNLDRQNFFDPTISIEQGMYMGTRQLKIKKLDKLFIKGILAGPSETTSTVDE